MLQKTTVPRWLVLTAGFLQMALVYAPSVNITGIFVPYLQDTFGVPLATIVGMLSFSIVGSIVAYLLIGKAFRRFPLERVVALSLVLIAVSYALSANAPSLPVLYAAGILRGFSSGFASLVPISIVLNHTFDSRHRGKALGFVLMGSGIGPIVLSPVIAYLIEQKGWQFGYYLFAAFALVMVPLVLVAFRLPAAKANDATPAAQAAAAPVNAGRLAAVILLMLLLAGVSHNWNSAGASYLRDMGYAPITVASMVSVTALGITLARPVYGMIADKWGTLACMRAGTVTLMLGYLLVLLFAKSTALCYCGVLVIGLGMATVNISGPLMTGDLFDKSQYASLIGLVQIGSSAGASILPLVMTLVLGRSGSYYFAWGLGVALLAVAIVLQQLLYRRTNNTVSL